MKTSCKVSVLAALVAVLALAAPSALAQVPDDVAGFYIADRLAVGSVTLEPGYYLLRAVRTSSNHDVLLVSDLDQQRVITTLIATPHQLGPGSVPAVTRLVFDAGEGGAPGTLRSWFIANKSFGFDIRSKAAPTQVASVRQGEYVALAWAR